MPDERSRPTRPPLHREEDPPPGQYRATHPRILPETIAQVALRAPKIPAANPDPHAELLRAISATEGRMLTEISDRREAEEARQIDRQRLFEEQLKKELHSIVLREVRSLPPPSPKKGFEWSHLQYVAGFVVALTGLIALILNAQKPSAEVLKRFDALDAAQAKADKRLEGHVAAEAAQRETDRTQDYKYALDVRSWVTDVLERAASVKIDDPPGTPPRDQLRFYPAPRLDSHRVTDTHIVQPRDPYPVPPPP